MNFLILDMKLVRTMALGVVPHLKPWDEEEITKVLEINLPIPLNAHTTKRQ